MKNWFISFLLLFPVWGLAQKYPGAEISNGVLQASLYLPAVGNGYYQGTRFDWAGVIYSLKYKGHEYFGEWNPVSGPGLHDAITGPAEEFMELGYDEARVGETFVRIGVGTLLKPEENGQSRFKTYEISNPGKRKFRIRKRSVSFVHTLTGEKGYAYVYRKEVRLKDNKLILLHKLENTGNREMETSVYNHNFFVMDDESTNANIKTTFAYEPVAEGGGFGNLAQIEGKSLVYLRQLKAGENVFSEDLKGYGSSVADQQITIENRRSGAAVTISADQPIEKMVFWASSTTSCPEPYIHLKVPPGKTIRWHIQYDFKTMF